MAQITCTVTVTQQYVSSVHETVHSGAHAAPEQGSTAAKPLQTVIDDSHDIRRRMVISIAVQTFILVAIGVLIVVLAPTLLPVQSVPLSMYFVGGVLIFTLLIGAFSACRVRTIRPADIVFTTPADPTQALSAVEMQEAKRYPVLFAFRSYNYGLLLVLAGNLISGITGVVPKDIQLGHSQAEDIKWPLIAFGAGFIVLAIFVIYNFVAADSYAKELQAKQRSFFSYEEIRRRQLEEGVDGAKMTLPAQYDVSPEETLQTVLRNN
ncbi:uncharacterized protein LOC129587997 [Paramacrobiotus metropolitanus]|uniref:uncharacterized protein LOC129587997 n=1 Tax=Paramacrobiotus metropolitanus TaxID=2943436 RepID=UPI00244648D7|nr:uncharacterized protein LOC129587997 [Paramacrobiotus metropolitanus]